MCGLIPPSIVRFFNAFRGMTSHPSVCQRCWNSLFLRNGFQAAWKAQFQPHVSGFSYKVSLGEIAISAKQGCKWCQFLNEQIPAQVGTDGPLHAEAEYTIAVRFRMRSGQEQRTLLALSLNDIWSQTFEVHTVDGNPAAEFIPTREVIWQVNSPATYAHAAELISECTTGGHDQCHHRETLYLPTRVVDCLDPEHPKLHITQGGVPGKYTALSYRWGEAQPHRMQTHNLQSYCQEIPVHSLPQTIQDAIHCTQQLGISFLWVDSLCIIQDSKEDKSREIPQIRKTFQNAFVTIVAASASQVSQGFLQDREPPPKAVSLPFRCDDNRIGSMWIREGTIDPREPIDTRAWCYEEKLLTQRALIFTSRTVRFQCQSHYLNIGNSNIAAWNADTRLPSTMMEPEEGDWAPLTYEESSALAIENTWASVLAEYTARDITQFRDRLIAFYGIAETFHRTWTHSQYLAGLWKHNLLEDLLWEADPPLHPRPENYRAPSWSWAAVNGKVLRANTMHFWREDVPECEIIDCQITLANEKMPYGEVTDGRLQLNASMKSIIWHPSQGKFYATSQRDSDKSEELHPGTLLGKCYPDSLQEIESEGMQQAYAIPLRSSRKTYHVIQGLIVVPCQGDHESQCFRRVGRFDVPLLKLWGDFDPDTLFGSTRQRVVIV
ncbi:hypothetical protein AKAW_01886 [Aspergillus luchuensis IFO 4308]|nr:hypothetical protein AKAW_01886 [Aspergillus luchuensis IFO 4308]